uniref:Uncharacterized protein n=1 Tax=Cacopsylla melanoneura TaxID=428564 RepID=A0A8D8QV33_9HEMI
MYYIYLYGGSLYCSVHDPDGAWKHLLWGRTFIHKDFFSKDNLNAPQSNFVKNQSLQRFKNGGSLYCLVHDPGAWRLIFFKESTEKRRSLIFFVEESRLEM